MEDKWIKIYECQATEAKSKILLQELLEENNIPYKGQIEHCWTGHRLPKYNEKFVIYVEPRFKSQAKKYIKEIDNEENILKENIKELQTNEDTEYEAKKIAKRQKAMILIYTGIVIAMAVLAMIAGIVAN